MISAPIPTFTTLGAVSLAELDAASNASLRHDRKYVVAHELTEALIGARRGHLAVLDIDGRREFGYTSLYFDTPGFELHRNAATGRRRRAKVRVRTYDDQGTRILEVKTKDGRGNTIKHRRPHDARLGDDIGPEGARFVDEVTQWPGLAADLQPALTTRYRRTTLLDCTTGTRITVDRDLVCTHVDGRSVSFTGLIIETKTSGAPGPLDRWLWVNGVRPERLSKYCTALAQLEPTLPANRWHRTIARHFRG